MYDIGELQYKYVNPGLDIFSYNNWLKVSKNNTNIIMYDTIRLKFKYTLNQFQHLLTTLRNLGYVDERKNGRSGLISYFVRHRYWHFTLTPTYLYCTGSLPQLLYHTNLIDLTLSDIQQAINELNTIIGIDISDAKVTRLDFACNIVMNNPVASYFKVLVHKSYCRVDKDGCETLTFEGNGEEFSFYDKIAQLQSKGESIPVKYQDKYVLRYEMRVTERVAKKLGCDIIKLSDLANEDFFCAIKERWYNEYVSIDKLSYDIPDFDNNLSQFKDYLMALGIRKKGLANIYEEVDIVFNDNYQVKSRAKKLVRKLTDNREKLNTNIALAELDEKMLNIMEVVY